MCYISSHYVLPMQFCVLQTMTVIEIPVCGTFNRMLALFSRKALYKLAVSVCSVMRNRTKKHSEGWNAENLLGLPETF